MNEIKRQGKRQLIYFIIFGAINIMLLMFYLSDTIIHHTTPQQFPISSFERFPLTYLIFPAEVFSTLFALYFVYNLLTDQKRKPAPLPLKDKARDVAVLIPVFNEPRHIVERTLLAAKELRWSGKVRHYLLDDSTDTRSKTEMDELCDEIGCMIIRREDRTGFKAGNINNAVKNHVKEPFFVILDSDQAPLPDFLEKTMGNFNDPKVGFVQTPQYFINEGTAIEKAAKVGNNIFFNAQSVSKSNDGAMPFCGTNAVIRTSAFHHVKGFSYFTATEDIELGIRLNNAGYVGEYVPQVLVTGFAPPDFKSYMSQQYRWANGNLAVLKEHWLKILSGNLSLMQQIHTFFTLGWWLVGFVTLVYIAVPILSLFFGGTHHTWLPGWMLAILFFNVAMGISLIYVALNGRSDVDKVSFGDALLQYSLITNSSLIYARAAINALLGRYTNFIKTDKTRKSSGIELIWMNLLLSVVCLGFSLYALGSAALATSAEQVRAFLPISVWLLFYGMILASSILFIGKAESAMMDFPVPVRQKKEASVGA